MATLVTWSVSGMGGNIYRGIPSRDVAIAMAIDFLRYPDVDEYDDDEWTRQAVVIDEIDEGPAYTLLSTEFEQRGIGVSCEVRCATCRCVPGRSHYVNLT